MTTQQIEKRANEVYQRSINELENDWKLAQETDPIEGAYKVTEAIMNHYDLTDYNDEERQKIQEIVEEEAFNGLT